LVFGRCLLDDRWCGLRRGLRGLLLRLDDSNLGLLRRDKQCLIAVQHGERQQNGDENPAFHVVDLRARDGIVPVPSERSTAGQPDRAEPDPATGAVKPYRLRRVVRAGWLESTGPSKQRRNKYFIAS